MRRITGVLIALAVGLVLPCSAHAAFPGENGKIAFARGGDIWTVNPDGTGATNLTNTPGFESDPSWSPDGSKIAFARSEPAPCHGDISVMNADGSGRADFSNALFPPFTGVTCSTGYSPTWSPSGDRIMFAVENGCDGGFDGIWRINADGTGLVQVLNQCDVVFLKWSPDGGALAWSDFDSPESIWTAHADGTGASALPPIAGMTENWQPDWSPDASKFVFRMSQITGRIWMVNRDGSGATNLGLTGFIQEAPAWSPDGSRIVMDDENGTGLKIVHPDGTGLIGIPNTANGYRPDWQPILHGYPRPKAATPMYVPLVPAYTPCASPNRVHAAPLSYNSCNPPSQTSGFATVGSPDANGAAAKSVGNVKLVAIGEVPINTGNGNQSDVVIDFSITDVRNKAGLADYSGGLHVRTALQITDRNNTPYPGGPGPATVAPTAFEFNVPCATTPSDATIGSTCSTSTTANAVLPGQVLERQRAIWELGRVEAQDGGADGNPATGGDNTLFATQGVFVP